MAHQAVAGGEVGRVETRNTAKYGGIRQSRERNTEYGNTGRGETRNTEYASGVEHTARLGVPSLLSPGQIAAALTAAIATQASLHTSAGAVNVVVTLCGLGSKLQAQRVLYTHMVHCLSRLSCRPSLPSGSRHVFIHRNISGGGHGGGTDSVGRARARSVYSQRLHPGVCVSRA
jgi:hypothetical protein